MPLEHRIDHAQRIVLVRCWGEISDTEIFTYQGEVWSRPGVAGYDELVDLTAVETLQVSSSARSEDLARVASAMDQPGGESRFAIVVESGISLQLAQRYAAQRSELARGRKVVQLFPRLEPALAWLGRPATLMDEAFGAPPGS